MRSFCPGADTGGLPVGAHCLARLTGYFIIEVFGKCGISGIPAAGLFFGFVFDLRIHEFRLHTLVDEVDFQDKSVRKTIGAAKLGDEREADQVFELCKLLRRDGKFDFLAGESAS